MRRTFVTGSVAMLVLIVGTTFAADFKSGPQKPTIKVRPFNPTHCNGEGVGTKACLV